MGFLTQYALQVALLLAAFYLVYRWTLAGSTFYRFNRGSLIAGYAVAFGAVPLWNWLTQSPAEDSAENTVRIITTELEALSESTAPSWPVVVSVLYLSGVLVATALTIRSVYKIWRVIPKGSRTKKNGYTLVRTERSNLSPFSWGRYIVIPQGVREEDFEIIEIHEQAHLRHRHWVDLALGQLVIIFNWFNPAAYLMMKELQDVHEFEADRDVVKSGIDQREYQMLLLRNVAGSLFPLLADSLNHSQLKSRIKLMMAPRSHPFRKIAVALALPVAVAVIIGINTPALASPLGSIAGISIFSTECNEVKYNIEGSVHSISYVQEGMTNSVSMDVEPGTSPKIYINRHLASADELRNIKSDDVDFIIADNIHNRFVIKTK